MDERIGSKTRVGNKKSRGWRRELRYKKELRCGLREECVAINKINDAIISMIPFETGIISRFFAMAWLRMKWSFQIKYRYLMRNLSPSSLSVHLCSGLRRNVNRSFVSRLDRRVCVLPFSELVPDFDSSGTQRWRQKIFLDEWAPWCKADLRSVHDRWCYHKSSCLCFDSLQRRDENMDLLAHQMCCNRPCEFFFMSFCT